MLPKPITIVLAEFEQELKRQDRSQSTIVNYISDVRLFGQWRSESYGDDFDPAKVVQREITEYRAFLTNVKRASPATINRRLASLSIFFRWCVATNRAKVNPADGVKTIAVVDPGPRALDSGVLRRLLREVHVHSNARDVAMIEMLCGTGLRVGELVSLQLDDFDVGERKGSALVRSGKGRVSREVPLNVDVRKSIQAYLEVRPATTSHFLFIGQRGEKMTPSGAWRIVKKYAALAGVHDMRVHDLRHTVLTRLVREFGCDLATVAKISGHRNIKTLLRYAEPTQDDLAAAVEKLALAG